MKAEVVAFTTNVKNITVTRFWVQHEFKVSNNGTLFLVVRNQIFFNTSYQYSDIFLGHLIALQ